VRWVVIGDGCWRDATGVQAEPTQRLDHELMRSAALPASSAVPAVNIPTMRHRSSLPNQVNSSGRW
jgi:hypothetical protein